MKAISFQEHLDALLRRRIKCVVEHGPMARLFRKGSHKALQATLFRRITPEKIAAPRDGDAYDLWLTRLICSNCWRDFSRNGLSEDRWGYFAKLINIVVYEVASNRELLPEHDWNRVRAFLHVPIDSRVSQYARAHQADFPSVPKLRGMTKDTYLQIQERLRTLAHDMGVPPIWFEDVWAS